MSVPVRVYHARTSDRISEIPNDGYSPPVIEPKSRSCLMSLYTKSNVSGLSGDPVESICRSSERS